MKVIDKINGSALFAQSAFSASTATKDSLGRDITATYLTGVNIPESATWNETSNVVSSNSAKWSEGKTYEGISPIVVNNNENVVSADTWVLSPGDGVSFTEDSANKVTRIDVTAQGGNYIPYTAVNTGTFPAFETNSGLKIGTLENGILRSTYISPSTIQIRYIYSPTGASQIKWGAVLSNSKLTFDTDSDSAYVDMEKIHTWDSASNYIQTISSTYYPKSNPSSFATESWVNGQGYLTAHQDISNKLDSSAFSTVSGDFLTTSFSIPESAVWNETSNVVQSNSAQWAEGGSGGSVSSKYETISVDGSNIEATNKAIEYNSNGFTSSFGNKYISSSTPAVFNWDSYSQETNIYVNAFNPSNESGTLTYSSNTNVTGEVTALNNSIDFNIQTPNATAIQFTTDISFQLSTIEVTAPSSFKAKELAWKSDLPTYEYNSAKKLSAINGSALVGNEDYLVNQGFVQNLTSPKGTINVLNNNKIEGTNSAIASDVIEGFVSAYNGMSVYPENSATLSWSNYVPNTILYVSGGKYAPTTLTYSADTGVTGQINLPDSGETSVEVPTDATSIVIGHGDWGNINYDFTVSAADFYEIGELAWASAIPTYEYDSTNKISAINGSALAGGSDVPSGTMNVSGLEYNAVNEISAYNGSAIAQYGAEKQWLVHDDTLIHASNSAQYALGVNVSALQRLMGIDETVLWSGSDMPSGATTASKTYSLSEPYNNFKEVKIYLSEELGRVITLNGESTNFQYYAVYPEVNGNKVGLLITPDGTTGLKFKCGFNNDGWTAYTGQNYGYYCLTKIVGIGRKA